MTSRSTTTSPKARSRPAGATPVNGRRSALHPPVRRALRTSRRLSQFRFRRSGFGSRIVTNPLQPGGEDATNMGSYLSLEGSTFQRMPGAGADDAPGGAFYSPERRLAGRTRSDHLQLRAPAAVQLAGVRARAVHRVAPAPAPSGRPGAQALAVGADGASRATPPGRAGSASSC